MGGTILTGGFVGFVWGWFHVPDFAPGEGWSHLATAYALPFAGLGLTLGLFLLLRTLLPARRQRTLVLGFAAAAVACYYWYRLPALFGFGPFPGDGMLVDAREVLPAWFPTASRVTTTALFLWWLVVRRDPRRSWASRPEYAA